MFTIRRNVSSVATHLARRTLTSSRTALLRRHVLPGLPTPTRSFASSALRTAGFGMRKPREAVDNDMLPIDDTYEPAANDRNQWRDEESSAWTPPVDERQQGLRPAVAKSNSVLVTNLPFDVTESELRDWFSRCGTVTNVDLNTNAQGFNGRASIEFTDISEAQEALKFHRVVFGGRTMYIHPSTGSEETATQRLFVANISFDSSRQDIEELFAPYEPLDFRFATSSDGRARGFAHVDFKTAEAADAARAALNGQEVMGRNISIAFSAENVTPRKASQQSSTLFVGNIPYETTEDEVTDLFAEFNPIAVRIATDEQGTLRGFAHVDFSNETEARRALEKLEGAELLRRRLRIDFAEQRAQWGGDRRGGRGNQDRRGGRGNQDRRGGRGKRGSWA
ncbi:hypothetical protein EIP86_004852 [Pleurotus ostreatoroseus]|nr:hypothetical protein EIP86_004852 [Pleurotus ostreatoroseus]